MRGMGLKLREGKIGSGIKLTNCQLCKNLIRPPKRKRCLCQSKEVPEVCTCGLGPPPQGAASRIGWDKVNNRKR